MKNIAIFASGAGSNAEKIIEHFITMSNRNNNPLPAKIALIVCNKPTAGVLKIAEKHEIPAILIKKEQFFSEKSIKKELFAAKIDFIVLAGFLWKIPLSLIEAYPQKMINIHPALLPKYGGKGMYGHHVHEAVIANKETESGITIHFVDEHYDHGATIFQATCEVVPADTADTLAAKIHVLEYKHFPKIVEQVVLGKV